MLIYMLYVYSISLGEVLEGIIFQQKFILTYHFFLSTQIKYTSHVNLSSLPLQYAHMYSMISALLVHLPQMDKHIHHLDADLSRFEQELQMKDPSACRS